MKPAPIHLLLTLVIALCGCASQTYRLLQSESAQSRLTALKAGAPELTNRTVQIPTRIGAGPTVRIALHETGNRQASRVIVLIHGCLSDHWTWRFICGFLGEEYCLILVDLPGTGDSDCPDPSVLGPSGYSPDQLADRVLQALDALLAEREQRPDITIVGHSLGGMIALRMMGSPTLRARYEDVIQHVDRMVLLSPGDFALVNPPRALMEIAELTGTQIAFADLFGILRDKIAQAVRDSVADPEHASREHVERLLEMLRDQRRRASLQAMLKQAVPMKNGGLDWPTIERFVSEYENVDVPCLIVYGARDQTLGVATGYKLAAQIPTGFLYILPGCKHSVQLDRPRICAEIIRRFSDTGSTAFLDNLEEEIAATAAGPGNPRQPTELRPLQRVGQSALH